MLKYTLVLAILLSYLAAATLDSQSSSEPAAQGAPIAIWPHGAPGGAAASGPERDESPPPNGGLVAGKTVIRLTNVSSPTITVYRPRGGEGAGAAVVVFPGGGYRILAMDLEGTEICHWLNSLGITAVLLKYRVPERAGVPNYAAPLEDAQRALGYVRYRAAEWRLNPHRIGVIGFSAGGNLAAVLSTNFEARTYKPVDDADRVSCRPDFAMLIYPAYLVTGERLNQLAPELKVTAGAPPTFLVQTEGDPVHVENSVYYFLALKNAKVPAEMHLYPAGRHGYGLRSTEAHVTGWPALAAKWLASLGVLGTAGGQ